LYGEDYVLTSIDRNADGSLDEDPFDSALEKASSLVDSYLAGRYDVPVAPTPPLLIYKCSTNAGAGLTDEKRTRYEDSIKWLKDVAKGDASIGVSETGLTTAYEGTEISTTSREFTRDSMRRLL
jgi:phage gp36-like protein